MNATELATDGLAAQECESLASCVARGQAPDTYADIVAKLKGHADNLPLGRKLFWIDQCVALGVTLYPEAAKKAAKSTKPEASSTP